MNLPFLVEDLFLITVLFYNIKIFKSVESQKTKMAFKKPNWGPPPENYIAGLGRG